MLQLQGNVWLRIFIPESERLSVSQAEYTRIQQHIPAWPEDRLWLYLKGIAVRCHDCPHLAPIGPDFSLLSIVQILLDFMNIIMVSSCMHYAFLCQVQQSSL